MPASTLISTHDVTIDIGATPILVRTDSPDFAHMLTDRYGEFVTADAPHPAMELEIRLVEPKNGIRDSGHGKDEGPGFGVRDSGLGIRTPDLELRTSDAGIRNSEPGIRNPESDDYDQELNVRLESGRWIMDRGDFHAEWDADSNRGWVRQTANPYAIDGVLRILHSLILARQGGFLVHAASAVRNGRAYVFAGASGAGKTTLASLAPPDVTLLTDEISYVRAARSQESGVRSREPGAKGQGETQIADSKSKITNLRSQIANHQSPIANPEARVPSPESRIPNPEPLTAAFSAFGTPFAGELARIGQKIQAPLAALFLLEQGTENRIEPLSEAEAARELLRHVLFFAQDEELILMIFDTICGFVKRVPVRRLVFTKDARVWELIA